MGGVRLETVLLSVKKPRLRYSSKDYGSFLGFEPICLVPFEPKLIDYSLMSEAQIDWLNNYNRLIREKVGPVLKEQDKGRYVLTLLLDSKIHLTYALTFK